MGEEGEIPEEGEYLEEMPRSCFSVPFEQNGEGERNWRTSMDHLPFLIRSSATLVRLSVSRVGYSALLLVAPTPLFPSITLIMFN